MWGPRKEQLEAYAEESGFPVPALEDRPTLPPWVDEIGRAFSLLVKTRTSNGFGYNSISINEIKSYIELFGEPWVGKMLFIDLLLSMNDKRLELEATKQSSITHGRDTPDNRR